MSTIRKRSAFALVELAAVVAVCVVMAAVLLAAGTRARRLANLGQDINKLHELALGTGLYTAAFNDQLWALSWHGNVMYNSPWPDLNLATSDLQAQANQAVEILRRRAGRTDIPRISGWIANVLYSHLPLADFLDVPLPYLTVVSSADEDRLRWAQDPACFDRGCFLPCQPPPIDVERKWPYSGSFQTGPAMWDRSPVGDRVMQAGANFFWTVPPHAVLGAPGLADVAYPSTKVHMFDGFAWYPAHETALFFAHPDADLPLLFLDGSARLKHVRDANPGWQPNLPGSSAWTTLYAFTRTGHCEPGATVPPPTSPEFPTPGVFRWTRAGIAGRDFGPEVPTAAPEEDAGPVRWEAAKAKGGAMP